MGFSRWKNLFVVLIMTAILTAGISFALQDKNYFTNQSAAVSTNQSNISAAAIVLQIVPVPHCLRRRNLATLRKL